LISIKTTEVRDDDRLAEGEPVLRQSAGLVGAQHVDPGKLLDRDQTGNDRLQPRQPLGSCPA
jgi:hypothetical protein